MALAKDNKELLEVKVTNSNSAVDTTKTNTIFREKVIMQLGIAIRFIMFIATHPFIMITAHMHTQIHSRSPPLLPVHLLAVTLGLWQELRCGVRRHMMAPDAKYYY